MKRYLNFVILVLLINIIICINSPTISWLIILSLDLLTLIIWLVMKIFFVTQLTFFNFIPLSSTCSGLSLAGIIIALFGIYNYYWIGFLWALINYIAMASLSKLINPNVGKHY